MKGMDKEKTAWLLVRLGVAFAFIYAALAGFVTPDDWIGFFPSFAEKIAPAETLLLIWGIVEIIIALWILSGKHIFIPSLIAALSLAGLIATNLGAIDILFRDVTILLSACALAVQSFRGGRSEIPQI